MTDKTRADKTGFSFAMPVEAGSTFKPLPDWVTFDLCVAYPTETGNLLLHNTRNGTRAMVRPEVYASLIHCSEFKTIREHCDSIIEANPGMEGQQADIQQVLQSMLDSGLMVSAKQTCDRLKLRTDLVTAETDAPIVAIITWERPAALERLLSSIASNCATEKLNTLYVIDDSRSADNIRKNRAAVEKHTASIKTPLVYFGRDEQKILVTELVQRLPQHEDAIRLLTDEERWGDCWSSGLSRNLALLVSCGRRLVVMDDDTICDLYAPPQPRPDITISDTQRNADFFASEAEWAAMHQPVNPDPINRHMQCLGLSLSDALNVLGQNNLKPAGLAHSNALLTSELEAESPVLVTECGTLGCPGTGKNTWLPFMAPKSLEQMLSSPAKTTNALNSRKVWSGRNQPHFAPRPNMSPIMGLDNRQMLPPYKPIFRGEDRLFGIMLDYVFPTSVTLDYPWAVPHLPIPERDWNNRDLNFTPVDAFPEFFYNSVLESKSDCRSVSPTGRLFTLAAWFRDLAASSPATLSSLHRHSRLRADSQFLEHLQGLLSTYESAPVDWQNYVRNGIRQLNVDMDKVSREDFVVKGLPVKLNSEELIVFWQEFWAGFAAALEAWPEIRQAAADLLEEREKQSR